MVRKTLIKFVCGASIVIGTGCVARAVPDAASSAERMSVPKTQGVEVSLFLVGDAGQAKSGDRILTAMAAMAGENAHESTLLFLGDNLYPDGLDSLGSPNRRSGEERLRVLAAVGQKAGIRRVVIPGNHDWNDSREGGWRAVVDQQEFIDGLAMESISFLPKGGCPGPSVIDLGGVLRLVILDTEWWLYDGVKAGPENSQCVNSTQTEVLAALDTALAGSRQRRVIVAAHHPLDSGGPHAGYLGWKDHIFPLRRLARWAWLPLPGIGSLYPLVRNLGVDSQDLGSSVYQAMKDSLEGVFRRHEVVAYVAGHDHSLQVIRNEATRFSLVSGAGPSTGLTPVAWIPNAEFVRSAWGFMRLDVTRDRRIRLGVYAEDSRGIVSEVYSQWLTNP